MAFKIIYVQGHSSKWNYSTKANSPLKWQKIATGGPPKLAFQMRLQNLVRLRCVLFWIFLNLADDVTLSPNQGDQWRHWDKIWGYEAWQTYLFLPHKFSSSPSHLS